MNNLKIIAILSFILASCTNPHETSSAAVVQTNFNCANDSILSTIISREAKVLDNNAKLVWDFNCDSSWLTFESSSGIKKILFSLPKELMELTTQLGHTSFQEFNHSVLYSYAVASGCCTPEDHYLYNKENGTLIKELGRALYVGERDSLPFFATLISEINDTITGEADYSVLVYNINNGKQLIQHIPSNDVQKGMTTNEYMYPEDVFDGPVIANKNTLKLSYHTDLYEKGKKVKQKTITFDLRNLRD